MLLVVLVVVIFFLFLIWATSSKKLKAPSVVSNWIRMKFGSMAGLFFK